MSTPVHPVATPLVVEMRCLVVVCQLTELKERCAKLENQCKAKHAAGERSKALNNFNDKYNSV